MRRVCCLDGRSGGKKRDLGFRLTAGVRGETKFAVEINFYMASDKMEFVHIGTQPFLF